MKKIIVIILAITISCTMLVSCSPTSSANVAKKNVTTYTTEGKVTKLVADKNATGELSLSYYGTDFGNTHIDSFSSAVEKFKELYPNVKLTIERVSNETSMDEYGEKLATEVMSGKGPDLFWTDYNMDIPKMMNAGVFADMHDYFEKDMNFNISDYNQTVFTGEQPLGKQYVIPLIYDIPLFLTTKSNAQKTGFDVNKCVDYESCAKELSRILDLNKNNSYPENIVYNLMFPNRFPVYTGLHFLDYENKTANVITDEMKRLAELNKAFYPLKSNGIKLGRLGSGKALIEGQSLFVDYSGVGSFECESISSCQLINNDDEAILFPWRNVNGKIDAFARNAVAVSNTSKNKDNAYRFIKILLSPEIQQIGYALWTVPISNIGLKQVLDDRMNSEKKNEEICKRDGVVKLEKLTPDFLVQYMGYIGDIEHVLYENKGSTIFSEEMLPYFENKKSYEECIKNAEDKLKIYISE